MVLAEQDVSVTKGLVARVGSSQGTLQSANSPLSRLPLMRAMVSCSCGRGMGCVLC